MTSDTTKTASLPRPAAGVPVAFDPPAVPAGSSHQSGQSLSDKRLVLCVTGSIAAYKSVILLRLLLKQGARVKVVLTPAAREFVQESTFSALTQEMTSSDMFGQIGEPHIDLVRNADAILVVPATADCLARLAHGHANDLVSALVLAARCPVLLAPAMHPSMWEHPRTQQNALILASHPDVFCVGPTFGEVASGETGEGRMSEPEEIIDALRGCLAPTDLEGRHVVVSAGPTRELVDPVRYLSNRSSGKMGFAVAARARERGARVTLVSGPVNLKTPRGVERVDVMSALEMHDAIVAALGTELSGADALIMTAAVADYRLAQPHAEKLKRGDEALALELVPNPDILANIGQLRGGRSPVLVGFALETAASSHLIGLARQKLIKKRVDMIVANRAESLESNESSAMLVGVRDCLELGVLPKTDLADQILDWLVNKLAEVESEEATE